MPTVIVLVHFPFVLWRTFLEQETVNFKKQQNIHINKLFGWFLDKG